MSCPLETQTGSGAQIYQLQNEDHSELGSRTRTAGGGCEEKTDLFSWGGGGGCESEKDLRASAACCVHVTDDHVHTCTHTHTKGGKLVGTRWETVQEGTAVLFEDKRKMSIFTSR